MNDIQKELELIRDEIKIIRDEIKTNKTKKY